RLQGADRKVRSGTASLPAGPEPPTVYSSLAPGANAGSVGGGKEQKKCRSQSDTSKRGTNPRLSLGRSSNWSSNRRKGGEQRLRAVAGPEQVEDDARAGLGEVLIHGSCFLWRIRKVVASRTRSPG